MISWDRDRGDWIRCQVPFINIGATSGQQRVPLSSCAWRIKSSCCGCCRKYMAFCRNLFFWKIYFRKYRRVVALAEWNLHWLEKVIICELTSTLNPKIFPPLELNGWSMLCSRAKRFKQMLLALTATEMTTKMEMWNYCSGQKNKSLGECQVWKLSFYETSRASYVKKETVRRKCLGRCRLFFK